VSAGLGQRSREPGDFRRGEASAAGKLCRKQYTTLGVCGAGAEQWDGGQKCYVTGRSWLQTPIQISNCASLQINDMRNGMAMNLADRKNK
jgi:hypothetical protein